MALTASQKALALTKPLQRSHSRVPSTPSAFLALKKATPALWNGRWGATMIHVPNSAPKAVLSFVRRDDASKVFAAINLSKLPAYWAVGLFGRIDTATLGILLITAVAGTYVGHRLTRILPEKAYVQIIQIALLVLSVRLVWDGVRTLA